MTQHFLGTEHLSLFSISSCPLDRFLLPDYCQVIGPFVCKYEREPRSDTRNVPTVILVFIRFAGCSTDCAAQLITSAV